MTPDAGSIITTIVGSYAFPVALVLLLGLFVERRLWPFFAQLLKDWQASEAQRTKDASQLNHDLIGVIHQNTEAMKSSTTSLNLLAEGQAQLRREFQARMEVLEKGQRVLAHRFKEHEEKTSG